LTTPDVATDLAPGAIPSPNIWHHPDVYELENRAVDRAGAQRAAAAMMAAVVNRDFSVVPLAGVSQIFGLRSGVDVGEPHPSAINQAWSTLSLSP